MSATPPKEKPKLSRRFKAWRQARIQALFAPPARQKLVADALGGQVLAVTRDCGDHVLSFNPKEYIGREILATGGFCREETRRVLDRVAALGLLAAPRATVVEIGANIGTQTVYFGLDARVQRVLAIEPDPDNLRFLQRNVSDNALQERVAVVAAGIAPSAGQMRLQRARGNSGGASFVPGNVAEADSSVTVAVRPLAEVLAEHRVAASDVALVWMDVEGFEPQLLPLLDELLHQGAALYMEFSPGLHGPQGTADFVAALSERFQTFELDGTDGWRPQAITELLALRKQRNVLLYRPRG